MARKEIYQIRQHSIGFSVIKGDLDFNPTGSYNVSPSGTECTCFASNKAICRHREMVQQWLSTEMPPNNAKTFREMMEDNYWYEYDRRRWVKGIDL